MTKTEALAKTETADHANPAKGRARSPLRAVSLIHEFSFDVRCSPPFPSSPPRWFWASREVQLHDCVFLKRGDPNPLFIAYLLNGLSDPSTGFASPEASGVRVLLRKQTADQILNYQTPEHLALGESQGAVDKKKMLKAKLQMERAEHGWVLLKTQDCPESLFQFVNLEKKRSPEIAAVEVFFSKPVEGGDKSGLLGNHWNSVFDHPFIPFDIKKRREQLASAYEKLKYFVEFHQAPNRRLPT